jgi:hypothetical protein
MQELYIIRITACHKPWRSSGATYTTSKRLFDFIDSHGECMMSDLNWTEYVGRDTDEENDFDAYECMDEGSVEPTYPFIVLGQTEIYTE